MTSRCNNKKNKSYKRYGARGIRVCERWLDIRNFIEDMGPSYKAGLTIDRIDNSGNYEPSNCRWVTTKEQNRNYSRNLVLTHNGKTQCLADWSIETGINYGTLWDRLKRGWSEHKALTTP